MYQSLIFESSNCLILGKCSALTIQHSCANSILYLIPAAIASIRSTHVSAHHRGRWCRHRSMRHRGWSSLWRHHQGRSIIHFAHLFWIIIIAWGVQRSTLKKSYTQLNVERRSLGLFLEVTYSLLLSLHCVPVAASGAPHTCSTHW